MAVGLGDVERCVAVNLNSTSFRIAEVDGQRVAVVEGEELACAKLRRNGADSAQVVDGARFE